MTLIVWHFREWEMGNERRLLVGDQATRFVSKVWTLLESHFRGQAERSKGALQAASLMIYSWQW